MTTRRVERAQRAEVKRQIAEAKKVLASLAKSRTATIKDIKRECRAEKKRVRARVKAWRKLQAEIAKAADYGARARARDECGAAQRKAMAEASTEAEGVRAAIAIQRKHMDELRRGTKPKNPRRQAGGHESRIKTDEALSEIAANLEGEYLAAYERFKHRPDFQAVIKRASRPGSLVSPSEAVIEFMGETKNIINDYHRAIESDAERDWNARLKELERLDRLGLPAPDEWPTREREPGDDDLPF